MSQDAPRVTQLPPPPLSELMEEVDFEDVRLSWVTPAYFAMASAIVQVPTIASLLMRGQPGLSWHYLGISPGIAALQGLCLVAGDRLLRVRWRAVRWLVGNSAGGIVVYGAWLVATLASVGPGQLTAGSQAALLNYALSMAVWALTGLLWGAAARSPKMMWWKLPTISAALSAVSGAASSAIWATVSRPPTGPPLLAAVLAGAIWPGVGGLLMGLAVAAALAQAYRSARAGQT